MMDIKTFLNRKSLTKAALCRLLGIDPKSSILSSYEKGRSNPSYEICEKLIPLGASAQELFGKELGDMLVSNSTAPAKQSTAQNGAQITPNDLSWAFGEAMKLLQEKKSSTDPEK
jgi:transcriptional regulator with XRE-family HTH domain